jgi:hypothetical protein
VGNTRPAITIGFYDLILLGVPPQLSGCGVALSALATHRTGPCGLKQLPPSLTRGYWLLVTVCM